MALEIPAVVDTSKQPFHKMEIVTLSSLGLPDSTFCDYNGSTLHFVDTGEQYVMYDGTWEPDLRLITALTAALKTAL